MAMAGFLRLNQIQLLTADEIEAYLGQIETHLKTLPDGPYRALELIIGTAGARMVATMYPEDVSLPTQQHVKRRRERGELDLYEDQSSARNRRRM